jgi:hypothetical protein
MLPEYHVIYSVRYYTRFHVTAVGFGTYYPWIWGTAVYRMNTCVHLWQYLKELVLESEMFQVKFVAKVLLPEQEP